MNTPRHKYQLDLNQLIAIPESPNDLVSFQPSHEHLRPIANLMLDAYRNTIDSEDETFADALIEVQGYFDNEPLSSHSWLFEKNGILQSGCLVSYVEVKHAPLITYIMTHSSRKRSGLAKIILHRTLLSLKQAGYDCVLAVITEGNTASENLFAQFGFERQT